MRELYRKNRFIITWILFAGYVVFNGILLLGHELWRDEANVWLLARDASPLMLLKEIKYQGHPCLWYLMVMPLAKLGLPFPAISVLSFLIMAAAAGVFVWKAPFTLVTKAVCLFSPMFSYYYPVVARNYCLIALVLILLIYLYPTRNEKSVLYGLLLGVLVQTDTIVLMAAGLISFMWLWEGVYTGIRDRSLRPLGAVAKGLWIPLVSLILLLLQFVGVSDSPEYGMRMLPAREMLGEIRNFTYHILTRMTGQGEQFDLLLILLFLAAGVLLSWKIGSPLPMIVAAGEFVYQTIFSIVVYQLHIWHYIALCFALIWFLWLGCSAGNEDHEEFLPKTIRAKMKRGLWIGTAGRVLAEVLLILLSVTMFLRWNAPEESSSLANAWQGVYSDGVHTADYISEYIGEEEVIISTNVSEASTVLAYLGKNYTFYYAGTGTIESFARYNEEQSREIAYEELLVWVQNSFPERDSFYLLRCPASCITDIPQGAEENWKICYRTTVDTARGENYILYRIPLS